MMKKSLISVIFWALVIAFLFIVSQFLIPSVRNLFSSSELFLVPFVIFSLLGLALIFFTIKEKIKGKLKWFLILTGVSAAGFFVSVFLHNIFYAFGVITNHIIILGYSMEIISGIFFIIAIFVCPLGFLLGLVGSMALFIRKNPN